ncbi:MAG: histidine kinase [Bacteroidales bacterium]|nr:histidine kinase [Bacteroidales bacterium]
MKRNTKIIAFASVIIFSIVYALLFKWGQTGNSFKAETIMYGAIILLDIVITGSIAYSAYKKFSKKTAIQLEKNIIPAFIVFVLIALMVSLFLVSIGVYTLFLAKGYDTTGFWGHLFKIELPGALKQLTAWILMGSVLFFYIIWRKALDREQKLREENLKYKYRNLKSQVNPHFLFNSLNTLSELVYDDPAKADHYIQKLSGIYRYVLENEENDLIPLKDELGFIQQYFDLQKVRDKDKIYLEIDVHGESEYKIIPVSLQLLVENVLKHNSMSREKPLVIRIFNCDDYIIVSNPVQRKNILEKSTRIGLSNLKERARLIVGRELVVVEENNQFIVKLPIIHLPK